MLVLLINKFKKSNKIRFSSVSMPTVCLYYHCCILYIRRRTTRPSSTVIQYPPHRTTAGSQQAKRALSRLHCGLKWRSRLIGAPVWRWGERINGSKPVWQNPIIPPPKKGKKTGGGSGESVQSVYNQITTQNIFL